MGGGGEIGDPAHRGVSETSKFFSPILLTPPCCDWLFLKHLPDNQSHMTRVIEGTYGGFDGLGHVSFLSSVVGHGDLVHRSTPPVPIH